jgi:hypothetical protein
MVARATGAIVPAGPAHRFPGHVRRLACAAALLAAPRALGAQGAIIERPSTGTTEWFEAPCLTDSVDAGAWPLYEVRGVRLRVAPAFVRTKVPVADELHFRQGRARLVLRVRRDASALFKEYYRPELTYRYCEGEIGGFLAEVISFRQGSSYGFAARWPDADRGDWLAAVLTAPTLEQATALRRVLFTLEFPGERRAR